jgi:hypothetical protein
MVLPPIIGTSDLPEPRIDGIAIPGTIRPGQAFDVIVWGSNAGGATADAGSITLSFQEAESVELLNVDNNIVNVEPDDCIFNTESYARVITPSSRCSQMMSYTTCQPSQTPITYPIAESYFSRWEPGTQHFIHARVTPRQDTNTVVVDLRVAMTSAKARDRQCSALIAPNAAETSHRDQRTFPVRRYYVIVTSTTPTAPSSATPTPSPTTVVVLALSVGTGDLPEPRIDGIAIPGTIRPGQAFDVIVWGSNAGGATADAGSITLSFQEAESVELLNVDNNIVNVEPDDCNFNTESHARVITPRSRCSQMISYATCQPSQTPITYPIAESYFSRWEPGTQHFIHARVTPRQDTNTVVVDLRVAMTSAKARDRQCSALVAPNAAETSHRDQQTFPVRRYYVIVTGPPP